MNSSKTDGENNVEDSSFAETDELINSENDNPSTTPPSSSSSSKQPTATINNDKKRKSTNNNNLTLNLHICVAMIISIFNKCSVKGSKVILPNNEVVFDIFKSQQFNIDVPPSSKRICKEDDKFCDDVASDKDKKKSLKFSMESRQIIFEKIIMLLFFVMETNNVSFLFSKEHLKFFLATRSEFINIMDFEKSNKIHQTNNLKDTQKKSRSSKTATHASSSTILPPGGILIEYNKSCEVFVASLVRCDPEDLKALKLIITHDIQLDANIYHYAFTKTQNFKDVEYLTDTSAELRPNYRCIQMPSSNIKRSAVLITKSVILCYDGANQFILPNTNIERDFSTKTLSLLGPKDFVIFDVLMGSKKNIIDIIDAELYDNNGELIPLSPNYPDRIESIINKFPDLKPIDIKYTSGNCIKKPDIGFDLPSYIYIKPPLTTAIVGTWNKNAYIAFISKDEKQMIVKGKCTISGSIGNIIMSNTYQTLDYLKSIDESIKHLQQPCIKYNDKFYELILDTENDSLQLDKDCIKYFQNVIPAQLINNRLGHFSHNPVAFTDDYKQLLPTNQKDHNIEEVLRATTIQDLAIKLHNAIDVQLLMNALNHLRPKLTVDYDA